MPDVLQPETRILVKQLVRHSSTATHSKCDAWIERRSAGKYRSMLAVVEGEEADAEERRAILSELVTILRDDSTTLLDEAPALTP
jgi:hypothetical protein